jgi:malonyl-CoA O-methyltransferase
MGIVQNKIIDNPFLLWVKTELSQRMAQNLAFIKIEPQRVFLENKISTNAVKELKKIYPKAFFAANFKMPISLLESIEPVKKIFAKKVPQNNLLSTYDLIWSSNLAIPKQAITESQIKSWNALNSDNGLLMLTYLGPDTAREFQEIFSTKPDIVDMHDFGDLLVHCGYSDPVMTMEYLKLEYETAEILYQELKALNLYEEMNDPQKDQEILEKIMSLRNSDGKWNCTLEIVYGHAWKVVKKKDHVVKIDANSILVKKK